jgi:hypothetical protein
VCFIAPATGPISKRRMGDLESPCNLNVQEIPPQQTPLHERHLCMDGDSGFLSATISWLASWRLVLADQGRTGY